MGHSLFPSKFVFTNQMFRLSCQVVFYFPTIDYTMSNELQNAISAPMDVSDYKAVSTMRVSRLTVQPENLQSVSLSAGQTNQVHFAIPSQKNSFLNPHNTYLNFTYILTGTQENGKVAAICNGTGSSFIRNLSTQCGSVELENISSYNALACIVDDFQPSSRKTRLGSILEDSAIDTNSVRGTKLGNAISLAVLPTTEKRRICIPLLSSSIGQLADKYFPVSNDLGTRLRITLEDPMIALYNNLTTKTDLGYKLENITLELEYLETDPSTYKSLERESNNIMKVHGTGIANYQTTISSGSTHNNILIPARFSSLKNYFTMFRLSDDVASSTAGGKNSTGCRVRDNVSSYQYKISGKSYPNLKVNVDSFTGAESMMETLKCFHALHNTAQDVVFNRTQYTQNDSTSEEGAFVFGIDFEENGMSSQMMSGIDTNGSNSFLSLEHSAACSDLTVDTFAFYDQIIEINTVTGEVMVSR
jgi:hypothetical protein